ncbi:heavy metal-associated isoprenylated plant protein 39-like [Triticum dicoccoides]|nr:heavy metal-associated isoprenylated plant protein 39-like [Triticum dicoccoides]
MSKKIVVKLEVNSGKDKQKAMKAVSALVGIDALSVDMATRKMTVIGMVDPVDVVSKLRKAWSASLDSVGPAKEPEKEGKKKDGDGKKDGADAKKEGEGEKKDGDGKDGAKKDDGEAKPPQPTEEQLMAEFMNQYRSAYSAYHNPYMNSHYVVQSMEENPNSCAIC